MHLVVAYLKYRPSKFDDSAIMHNFNALPLGNLSTNLNFDFLDDTTLGIFINLRNLKVLTWGNAEIQGHEKCEKFNFLIFWTSRVCNNSNIRKF